MSELHYPGQELELFSQALNWKQYWLERFRPFLGEQVLEVGAGLGANANLLLQKCNQIRQYTALEPDPGLCNQAQLMEANHSGRLKLHQQTLKELSPANSYNSILYIDVIEHIEQDAAELELAYQHLLPGGYLLVLVPAHPFLYSPFDKAIGHYRRYNKKSLRKAGGAIGSPLRMEYLDSMGFCASLTNKCLLKQQAPSFKQVLFWDKKLLPLSRRLDSLFNYSIGKTLTAVWKKES